jgi:hypothetical protein
MRAGDVANAFSLFTTISFVAAILFQPSLFAKSYLAVGFCVSFADTVFNSHSLCFAVDLFFTVILGLLCLAYRRDSRLDRLRQNYLGVLGHGVGHLSLYLFQSNSDELVLSNPELSCILCVLFIFWFGFFYSLTSSVLVNATLSMIGTVALVFFVPRTFGFTFVQTVLMTIFVTRDLVGTKNKDASYDSWSWCVNVPVVVVGWIEALSCS